jgi:hypothetical protein
MMDWLKTCRILKNWGHKDSWIDKLGYTALGAESGIREEKIKQPKIGEVMTRKMVDQIIENTKNEKSDKSV